MPPLTLRRVLFATATPAIILGTFSKGLGPLGSKIVLVAGLLGLLLEVAWLRDEVAQLRADVAASKQDR